MTDHELKTRLQELIALGSGSMRLRDVLVEFAAAGGEQERAIEVLGEVEDEAADETAAQAVYEALEVATGYCSPSMKVW